jgi:hypothetical protein
MQVLMEQSQVAQAAKYSKLTKRTNERDPGPWA